MSLRPGIRLNALVVGLVMFAVTACGGSSGSGNTQPSTPSGRAAEVHLMAIGGATQQIDQSLAADFKKQTGMSLTVVPQTASSIILTQLQAGQANPTIDVAELDYGPALQGVTLGLFQPLDTSKVTNVSKLYSFARQPKDMGALAAVGALGIVYDPDTFKSHGWAPPTSWNDLLRPEFAHKVVMPNSTLTFGPLMALRFAEMNGGSVSNLEPGFKVLAQLAPNVVAWQSTIASYSQLFESGEAVIGVWSNFGSIAEKQKGVPMEFVLPKEGGYNLPEWIGVTKGAPNAAGANLWIQFRLGQRGQSAFASGENYGPTNQTVKLPADVSARVIGPSQASKLLQVDWPAFNSSRSMVAQRLAQQIQTIH